MEVKSKKKWNIYLNAGIWFIAALVLDQMTKWMAVLYLKEKEPFVLIPGVFELQYLENRGAAFGIFQGKQVVFMVGAILVCIVIAYFYGKIPSTRRFLPLKICSILICAGAVGNLVDRLRFNYVIDFFYFSLIDFPIFNVADCYVVVACILFAFLIFFVYKDEELNWFSIRKKA